MCFFKSLLFLRLLSPHLILENLDSHSHVPEFVQFICAGEGSSFSFYLPYFISERQKLEKRNKQDFQSQCVYGGVVPQSCPSLYDPMHRNPPGSSVHGISPARILEWVATFSSRGSSPLRDQTCVPYTSCIGRWILYHRAIWEASQSQ